MAKLIQQMLMEAIQNNPEDKGHFAIFGDADLEETWDGIVQKLSNC